MQSLRDHLMPKTILKPSAKKNKDGIKNLIYSSVTLAHKVSTDSMKTVDVPELKAMAEADENADDADDDADEDDEFFTDDSIRRSLSSSMTMSTYRKLQSGRQTKVVSVFPDKSHSQEALSKLRSICKNANTDLTEIKFENLEYGAANVMDTFYNAHICIVDMSSPEQQASLFYHMGVRESTGMKENIVIVEDVNEDKTTSLKVRSSSL